MDNKGRLRYNHIINDGAAGAQEKKMKTIDERFEGFTGMADVVEGSELAEAVEALAASDVDDGALDAAQACAADEGSWQGVVLAWYRGDPNSAPARAHAELCDGNHGTCRVCDAAASRAR